MLQDSCFLCTGIWQRETCNNCWFTQPSVIDKQKDYL
jgi:hypothetical protein